MTGVQTCALPISTDRSSGRIAKVSIAIRPEDLSVGSTGPNVIPGKVENVEYGGHDSLIDVSAGPGVLLHVRTSERVHVGEQVKLTVAPDRVLVYPGETA